MPKNYVILCDDDVVIFPIKADESPYAGGRVYCPGEPQFFGGNEEGREGILATLQREVDEESSGTYALNGFVNQPVFRGTFPGRGGRPVQCDFYYSTLWNRRREWPSEAEWGELPAAYREMCFVAAVRREDFAEVLGWYPDIAIPIFVLSEILIVAAKHQAPEWVRRQIRDRPSGVFSESLTCQAFIVFINLWLRRQLPGWPVPPPELVARSRSFAAVAGASVPISPSVAGR
jgi:hypothetical protein